MKMPKGKTPVAAAAGTSNQGALPGPPAAAPAQSSGAASVTVPAPKSSVAIATGKVNRKEKKVRASYSMPESQVALLAELKARCVRLGISAKKGEILVSGLHMLNSLHESEFEATVAPFLGKRKVANGKMRKK